MGKNYSSGVTLVELAIVIVIIGLLVAGALGGKELVHEATIESDISSFTDTKTAINTFYLKYHAVPGDMKNATTFWPDCQDLPDLPAYCNGNGNGDIQIFDPAYNGAESIYVFEHLSRAGLIKGSYRGNTLLNPPETASWGPVLKTTKQSIVIKDGAYLFIILNSLASGLPNQQTVNVDDVREFDTKLDDGKANTGNIQVDPTLADDGNPDHQCIDADGNYKINIPGPFICNIYMRQF